MIQKELENALETLFQEMRLSADNFTATNNYQSLLTFKRELKVVKALMQFVREHRGETGMKMGDKCRKLYNLAGAMEETFNEIEEYNPDSEKATHAKVHLEKLVTEWKKSYEPSILQKLEKQMLGFKYSGIPITLLQNFMNNFFSKTD